MTYLVSTWMLNLNLDNLVVAVGFLIEMLLTSACFSTFTYIIISVVLFAIVSYVVLAA